VRFIGLDSYEAAGGTVKRDLFSDDEDGWIEDAALLDRLASEKPHCLA
jgi:ParB family chromosome partitioning protein